MPGTKISALTAATAVAGADQLPIVQSATMKVATASMVRGAVYNTSVAAVSAAYAADTYLAGSAIVIPTAGGWKVSTVYGCIFDMTKTAAGTGTFVITVRMGTLGTTGDPAIVTLTYAAGTAAADTGLFEVLCAFRTVGSGSSAVLQGMAQCTHHLAATGLISTGASGTGIILATSAGFASTTQTIIGVSVNGGASFSGTKTIVQASVAGI